MSVRIKGTTNLQEVDANGFAFVKTTLVEEDSGYTIMTAENDAGTITGSRQTRTPEVDADYRLITSSDSHLFADNFPGVVLNSSLWSAGVTTMSIVLSSGFAQLNAGLSVASGAVALLKSYRFLPTLKQSTTRLEWEAQFTQTPQTNNVCEMGMFISAGTAAPTDGVFFRLNSVGNFIAVINYNGTETVSATIDFSTLVGVNTTRTFLIYSTTTVTSFWIDNILVAEIVTPAGQGANTASCALPLAFRNYNTAATSLAQVLKIGSVSVLLSGPMTTKPWGHVVSGSGAHSSQGQSGGAIGSTAIISNASPAAAAAVVNVTAAAQFVGLGGVAQVLPTLTAGTPGILFSYLVPVGTSLLPGRNLIITSIIIDSGVQTTLVGGPINYVVNLNYGATAVSPATAEGPTTKGPRRAAIGMINYPLNAAAGTGAYQLRMDFGDSPIHVNQGEFIQIMINNLGTVTSAGAIAFTCAFTGYWE